MTKNAEVTKAAAAERISDVVYSFVRTNIDEGRIRPNEMLIEFEIADELGVSRSPVREALQRLVADGLVDLVRRRWIVHEFTETEVVEIYEARSVLEAGAAKMAASAITSEQRQELERFRASFELHMQGDLEQRVYRNNEFHSFVVQCANSSRLERFCTMNNTYHFNFDLARLYSREDLIASATQHIELIDAVLGGDGERASHVAETHVLESLAMVRQKVFREDFPRSR